MSQWCQLWAPTYNLISGVEPTGPSIVIFGGLARLATILLFLPGTLTAQLVPRVVSFRRLHSYLRRLAAGSIRVRLPPSLRVSEHGPDASVILRDGDAFEVYNDASHATHRPGQQIPTVRFSTLPHFFAWHMPFRLAQSGWVRVWSADYREGRASERFWIAEGSIWTPHWCQFQPTGTLPGPERWVPAAGAEDDCCHFVRQSDLGQAHVLLHNPDISTTFRCVRCPSAGGEQAYPSGWRLRADLAARSPVLHLRDGDVMVPGSGPSRRRVQFRALSSFATLFLGARRSYLLCALLAIGGNHLWGAQGMQLPDSSPIPQGTCHVGKFNWRVPSPSRPCHFAVTAGAAACMISPFTGTSDTVPVTPDTNCDSLADLFLGSEPAWASHLVPIWPTLAAHVLTFAPEPAHPSLAVIIVVSPDWQAAFLVPRRTDPNWVLNYIRGFSRYPISRIRPPPNACTPSASANDAIDWRTGDVVFAQPGGDPFHGLAPPLFSQGMHVRHRAMWAIDFRVSCPMTILLWRPGWRPAKTTMPPDAYIGRPQTTPF